MPVHGAAERRARLDHQPVVDTGLEIDCAIGARDATGVDQGSRRREENPPAVGTAVNDATGLVGNVTALTEENTVAGLAGNQARIDQGRGGRLNVNAGAAGRYYAAGGIADVAAGLKQDAVQVRRVVDAAGVDDRTTGIQR